MAAELTDQDHTLKGVASCLKGKNAPAFRLG